MTTKTQPAPTRYVATYAAEHMAKMGAPPRCEGECRGDYHRTPEAAQACADKATRQIRRVAGMGTALPMPVEAFTRTDFPSVRWVHQGRADDYGDYDY